MIEQIKQKRRFDFWRSYSFVLTLAFLVSLFAVPAAALDISVDSSGVPVAGLYSGASAGDTVGVGYRHTMKTPYFSNTMYLIVSPFSYSLSGSILTASASGSTGFLDDGLTASYTNQGVWLGWGTGVSLENGSITVNISFPEPVYSYQFVGSVSVTSTLNGTSRTLTQSYNTDTYFSAEPVSIASVSIPFPSFALDGKPSTVTGTVRIDLSNLRVVSNFDLTMVALQLPSGQYLGSNGKPVSGTNVPAYKYLTEGFLGLRNNLVGSGVVSTSFWSAHGGTTGRSHSSLLPFLSSFANELTHNQFLIREGIAPANGVPFPLLWDSSLGDFVPQGRLSAPVKDILSYLYYIGLPIQNDLAKLRYVLASDDDIEIQKKNEPVKDEITNQFTGDAPAAVKPGDVGDMAGFSGDLQGAFTTGANAGDVFGFITGGDGWGFWSQEVAGGLHNVPSSASDDSGSVYYKDIDSLDDLPGDTFVRFYDSSALDSYLSGGAGK